MQYKIQFKPRAIKDGKRIPRHELNRILGKIEEMKNDLYGDIKQLTNYTSEYRLRVGNYRVLFEIEGDEIVIYRIRHRKEIYRKRRQIMLGLHPNILEKDGKKEFVILPYEEFAQIQEELVDYEDLKELRLAKEEEKYSSTISLEEARKEFGL